MYKYSTLTFRKRQSIAENGLTRVINHLFIDTHYYKILIPYEKKRYFEFSLEKNLYNLQYLTLCGMHIINLIKNLECNNTITTNGNLKLVRYLTNLGISVHVCSELSIAEIVKRNKLYLLKIILQSNEYHNILYTFRINCKTFGYSSIIKYYINRIIKNSYDLERILYFIIEDNYIKIFKYLIKRIKENFVLMYTAIFKSMNYNNVLFIKIIFKKYFKNKLPDSLIKDLLIIAKNQKTPEIIKFLTEYKK